MKDFLTAARRLLSKTTTGPLAGIRIWNGYCMVTNSRLSYTTYIEQFKHLNVLVDARKFIGAVSGTKFAPTIRATPKFIVISKGSFRARMQLWDPHPYPVFAVQGDDVDIGIETFRTLRRLQPFISTDASRPWACSIYFDTQYAYATNNVVLVRQPLVVPRSFVLPAATFDELLRVKADVSRVTINANAVRFIMADGISLHSLLTDADWPNVAALIKPCSTQPIPKGMKAGVEAMIPLCDNMKLPRINLNNDGMFTDEGSTAAKHDAWSFPEGSFHAKSLLDVLCVADNINFAGWPKPCYFTGTNGIEGVMLGLIT